MPEQSFQLLINGVPYIIKAKPFEFNAETRFSVSYNGSEDFIFAYDPSMKQFVSIGDDASTIPADLEVAIAEKLYSVVA